VYVGGNIPRRIGSLQHSMQLLSDADLKLEISQSVQDDEIASIANELQAFRESMIEAADLRRSGQGPRRQGGARPAHEEQHHAEFEATVRGARQPAELGQFQADDRA
jgi:hypothetical protein